MQEFLERLRNNPRAVVTTLIVAGVVALGVGNATSNNESDTDVAQTDTTSESTEGEAPVGPLAPTEDGENEEAPAEEAQSEEETTTEQAKEMEAPAELTREDGEYSVTVQTGDNQTTLVRQMVNDYLTNATEDLSAEQKLYVETVVVDSIPRNDVIHPGDVIRIDEVRISDAIADSGNLTDAQIKAWSAYL